MGSKHPCKRHKLSSDSGVCSGCYADVVRDRDCLLLFVKTALRILNERKWDIVHLLDLAAVILSIAIYGDEEDVERGSSEWESKVHDYLEKLLTILAPLEKQVESRYPLIADCAKCRDCKDPVHDFHVPDELWEKIVGEEIVLCWDCFANRANEQGIWIFDAPYPVHNIRGAQDEEGGK